jgi:aminoglycoside phosphotransferase (APT) family kinase protein
VQAITQVDESGGEARTYTLDESILLKVQRPQQVRTGTSLAKEVFFLNQLAAFDSTLPVPKVLGYARETNLLEYTVMTRMPGAAVATTELSTEARRAVVFSVGRVLRRIHAIPQTPFLASGHFPTDYSAADFKARIAEYFEVAGQKMHDKGQAWPFDLTLERVAERTLAALPEVNDFVALHANPGPPHTFVDPHTGQFVGLIDFGDAYISHPVLDVGRWRWPLDRPQALAGYTADAPVSAAFLQTWNALAVVGDIVLLAFYADRSTEIVEDLKTLLKALG